MHLLTYTCFAGLNNIQQLSLTLQDFKAETSAKLQCYAQMAVKTPLRAIETKMSNKKKTNQINKWIQMQWEHHWVIKRNEGARMKGLSLDSPSGGKGQWTTF